MKSDEFIASATETTGLTDFGDDPLFGGDGWRVGLEVLLDSITREANLHEMGEMVVQAELTQYLVNRLRIVDHHRQHPEIRERDITPPIVIVGQARTGTTMLFDLLAQDPNHRVPQTWEVDQPLPPPRTETYATDPRIAEADATFELVDRVIPEFRAVHQLGAQLAQECVRITASHFVSAIFPTQYQVPTYLDWLLYVAQDEGHVAGSYTWHRRFLELLQSEAPGDRWLIKTPFHCWTLPELMAEYPDALLVQTHRDPAKVMASTTSLLATLRKLGTDDISSTPLAKEFFEIILGGLERTVDARLNGVVPVEQVADVQFGDMMNDPIPAAQSVYDRFGWELTPETQAAMETFLKDHVREGCDARRHEAVLAATRELLAELGYTALTFSEVAKRGGVTRQLVYRWWPAKVSLVSEALFASGLPTWPTTYGGPLERDLRAFVQAIVDYACRDYVRAGLSGLITDATVDTPLPGLVDGLLDPLRASLAALVDAGTARGEVRRDLDIDLTLNTIRGAITMHLIADQTPPDVVVSHISQLMAWALRTPKSLPSIEGHQPMGTYAVTGSASGMGREVVDRLRATWHDSITVDLRDADIVADLSDPSGRAEAAEQVLEHANGHLNGAVLAAGLGPLPGQQELIGQVNYHAPTELLLTWRGALAAAAVADQVSSKVVVFGSNAATVTPGIPASLVRSFLNNRPAARRRVLKLFGQNAPAFAYGGSKLALTRWVRRTAVTPEWAGCGIRLNVIAPGAIMTPLLQTQLDGPDHERIETFPIPVGGYGDAGQIADWAIFMLSPAADFLCGSVVYVDGGTDAYYHSDTRPTSTSLLALPRWLKLTKAFADRTTGPAH